MKRFKVAVGAITTTILLLLPGAIKLSNYRHKTVEGVTTIDDAVAACQNSRLRGWELVAHAQQLVARKFTIYSTRNLWDTPKRAFAYGMGYCTQYNLALKQLLEQLGFETTAVFSLKVEVFDNPEWTIGHTWLQVTYNGETREVCAGRVTNLPGENGFRPLWPVWRGTPVVMLLTHLGMIPFCGVTEWKAVLWGEDPGWTFRPS